jgi:hypothetical protein
MFDIERWLVIERHLQRFPGGITLCERVRQGEVPWPAIGEKLLYCTEFPVVEFRDLLASGDFDVRWPLSFAAWYKISSSESVDQACVDFLTTANLWDEALQVFPEYSERSDLSSWLSIFKALKGEIHDAR